MKKQEEDIKAIREIMEKSTKFLSLSGLSGIMAGTIALIGAGIAQFWLLQQTKINVYYLVADAALTLLLSIAFAVFFSIRKARKKRQKLVNSLLLRVVYNLAIPLLAGGILSLIIIARGEVELVASITLIFYGLALINASKFTLEEIHYLGLIEIALGIGAAIFLCHGILFWTIGFGICHIIYGIIMYRKYDFN